MKDPKVGERVATYCSPNRFGSDAIRNIGEIVAVSGGVVALKIDGRGETSIGFHRLQCVRLKPRAKSVRVTQESLARIWDEKLHLRGYVSVSKSSDAFTILCKALGLGEV